MKKHFLAVFAALAISGASFAWEFPGFEWGVGTDVTSAYLWRGLKLGGLAVQPDVTIGYGGLNFEAWANISPTDYTFGELAPELDLTLSYTIVGLTVGVTHQYYFDNTKFFDYTHPTLIDYEHEDFAGNQTEVFAKFALGDLVENVPLTIMWSTYVGGDDWYLNDNNEVTKAYSSYLELTYDAELPLGFTLSPTVGITPWKSMYNFYEKNFSVNNISLKLNWELEVGDHFALDLYAIGMLNPSGINKNNIFPGIADSYNNQRLNGAIGIGLWLF